MHAYVLRVKIKRPQNSWCQKMLTEDWKTSRPKARDGHRYPCPALVFCNGSSYASRAAAPEGTRGDDVLQNRGNLTDGQMDGRTDVQIPHVLRDFVSSGSLRSRCPFLSCPCDLLWYCHFVIIIILLFLRANKGSPKKFLFFLWFSVKQKTRNTLT